MNKVCLLLFVLFVLPNFVLAHISVTQNSFNYSGVYTDNESGLQYLNARSYDPMIKRFIQWDTYSENNKSNFFDERYNYAADNPVTNEDPSGHCIGAFGLDIDLMASAVEVSEESEPVTALINSLTPADLTPQVMPSWKQIIENPFLEAQRNRVTNIMVNPNLIYPNKDVVLRVFKQKMGEYAGYYQDTIHELFNEYVDPERGADFNSYLAIYPTSLEQFEQGDFFIVKKSVINNEENFTLKVPNRELRVRYLADKPRSRINPNAGVFSDMGNANSNVNNDDIRNDEFPDEENDGHANLNPNF